MPLADLLAEYDVPGASVARLADGRVTTECAGVLSTETGEPVRPESPFMVQSVTKVWTATLVVQLVDEGLLDLDDRVVRHLPGFRTTAPAVSDAITVRHLLTHTGGFEGDLWMATTDGDDALQRLVEDHVPQARQYLPPGVLFSYCSAGYAVLGRLVEVLRGTTYAEALRRWLTDPLGVGPVLHDEAPGAAIGHIGGRPLPQWAVMPRSNPAAGNRLAMPARGLLELGALFLRDGGRMVREPLVPIPATVGGWHQGLGWRVRPADGVVMHDGGAPGVGALLRVVPERGEVLAVVANGGSMGGLFGALSGEPPLPVPEPGPVDERHCGRYELRTRVSDVSVEDGRLVLTTLERNETAEMDERAGVPVEPQVGELRRLDGELFVRVHDGRAAGTVEFVDGFLHTGRAAPRVG